MFDQRDVALVVEPSPSGGFVVNAICCSALKRSLGEFATRSEAEAWILQRSLADDDQILGQGILKPGQGQGLA